MNSIWAISSVSIAAQIATFPLGLHYFHQFPNYFLFSNLIVIPLSTIVIYLGLSMFVFAKVSIVVGYLAIAFNSVVWLLNSSVKWMEQLPFALIEKISISVFETWLIYIAIVTFLFYLSKRKFMYLIISLVMTMCILCYQVVQQHSEFKQRQLIVYNISKTSAIDFVNGKQNVLYTDSLFATNESRLMFHVKHNWWDLGLLASKIVVADYENSFVKIKNDFIQFGRKRIKIINKKNEVDDENKNAITLDYIILSGNPKISIENIVEKFKPTNIIFDSSNSQKQIEKWTIACKRLNVGYYSVENSGAFILNF
jgi:competence protein ComEC